MMRLQERSVGVWSGLLAMAAGVTFSISGCAAAVVGLGVVCCAAPVAAAVVAESHRDGIEQAAAATVTIEIPEVDCAGCSLEVRKAIKGAGGVRRLNEGSPKNRIVVTYEPASGRPDVYVEALRKAGFAKARVVA